MDPIRKDIESLAKILYSFKNKKVNAEENYLMRSVFYLLNGARLLYKFENKKNGADKENKLLSIFENIISNTCLESKIKECDSEITPEIRDLIGDLDDSIIPNLTEKDVLEMVEKYGGSQKEIATIKICSELKYLFTRKTIGVKILRAINNGYLNKVSSRKVILTEKGKNYLLGKEEAAKQEESQIPSISDIKELIDKRKAEIIKNNKIKKLKLYETCDNNEQEDQELNEYDNLELEDELHKKAIKNESLTDSEVYNAPHFSETNMKNLLTVLSNYGVGKKVSSTRLGKSFDLKGKNLICLMKKALDNDYLIYIGPRTVALTEKGLNTFNSGVEEKVDEKEVNIIEEKNNPPILDKLDLKNFLTVLDYYGLNNNVSTHKLGASFEKKGKEWYKIINQAKKNGLVNIITPRMLSLSEKGKKYLESLLKDEKETPFNYVVDSATDKAVIEYIKSKLENKQLLEVQELYLDFVKLDEPKPSPFEIKQLLEQLNHFIIIKRTDNLIEKGESGFEKVSYA